MRIWWKRVGYYLLAVLWLGTGPLQAVEFAGGTGEPNDPYQIATAEQLISLGEDPNLYDKHFALVANIDLDPNLPGRRVFDGAVIASDLVDGVCRGPNYRGIPFTGSFDGRGHLIKNLVIKSRCGNYIGLFGVVNSGAHIINLGIENGFIQGAENIGLVAGCCGANTRIVSCYGNGCVVGARRAGGLVGSLRNEGEISCCYSEGYVTARDFLAGGLVGDNGGFIITSYAVCEVSGKERIGGLVGDAWWHGSCFLAYWVNEFDNPDLVGSSHQRSEPEMKTKASFRGWGHLEAWTLDEGNDFPRLVWQNQPGGLIQDPPRSYGGGTGTPDDPYQIWTPGHLSQIGWSLDNLDKCFIVMKDIDLSTVSPNDFNPIGALGLPYTGVFDGGHHAIENFHFISEHDNNVGLFGSVGSINSDPNLMGGKVLNVCLTNVKIAGHYSVGALVAVNGGTIEQCRVSGSTTGWQSVGGVVGRNREGGAVRSCRSDVKGTGTNSVGGVTGYNTGRITLCQSTASITGEKRIGGLVGYNYGKITDCFATGNVLGGDEIGGLVGANGSTVMSCYATGRAIGDEAVGGLVGSSYGTIVCSYSTTTVQGDSEVGGLVGRSRSSVHLSYWDIQTSGMTASAGGKGRTTECLMNLGTYRGWGGHLAWTIDIGRDYPRLAWEDMPGHFIVDPPRLYGGGTGTADDPYQIRTAQQFTSIHWYWSDYDKHFILMQDLTLEGVDPNLVGPIGTSGLPFTGVFDGHHHTISNWTHLSHENYVGVFGYIQSSDSSVERSRGLVRNLHFANLALTGSEYVGGIAGGNEGTILGCTANVDISADGCVGAIVGINKGYINSCQSRGEIDGQRSVGGIVGNNNGSVLSCYTESRVHGDAYIGGLVGSNSAFHSDGMIRSSHSDAHVSGKTYVGGLLGYTSEGTVVSCISGGHVRGENSVGGLIGQNRRGTATMCQSQANVTGTGSRIGGLIGWNDGGMIEQCAAMGQVEGQSAIGGLVGSNYEDGFFIGWPERCTITFCYARGAITGTEQVGGLVGFNRRGTVYGCYSTGRISGSREVGGLMGIHGQGPVRLCYWDIESSGMQSSPVGSGHTTRSLMMSDTFFGWGDGVWCIDEGNDYPRLAWEQTTGQLILETEPRYGGGTGALDDPYQIWTAHQLVSLAYRLEDYGKHFVLMADVNLATVDPHKIVPIGMDLIPFTGAFEGNGHTISNFVYENEDEDHVGLFGSVGPGFSDWTEHAGVIRNVHLVNTRVRGNKSVGSIAGESCGSIIACSVSGDIQGLERTGGLVGENWGVIKQCWTTASVTGEQDTGGLVGFHKKSGENQPGLIRSSYSIAQVEGRRHAGGLAGSTEGWIEACYSQSQVAGVDTVGGLVGHSEPRGTIMQCYSAGPVDGSQHTGGLVGRGPTRCTFQSFWDSETSGVTASAGGSGKTTAQMLVAETFTGWGNPGDWTIVEGADYPRLVWENTSGALIIGQPYAYGGGSGQPEDPYQLWTAEQLVSITDHFDDFNKCFILMADIDLHDIPANRMRPIGSVTFPFTGVFDGNHYTIHNFHHETTEDDYVGLFGYIGGYEYGESHLGGTVRDLSLDDVTITGGEYAGGLVGACYGGSLISCEVSGRVAGNTYVGGLVGQGWCMNVTFSSAAGVVEGWEHVGGLIGRHQGGHVVQCNARCQSSAHKKLGGLVGSHLSFPQESCLIQCSAMGFVRGHSEVGGLVGDNSGIINNCYSTANVVGEEYTWGGIVMRTMYSSHVAGLVGTNSGLITFSYANSSITGRNEIGGLVAFNNNGSVSSSFWDMETSELSTSEGGTGLTTTQMQDIHTFLVAEWDFANIWMICEGDYPRLQWEGIQCDSLTVGQ